MYIGEAYKQRVIRYLITVNYDPFIKNLKTIQEKRKKPNYIQITYISYSYNQRSYVFMFEYSTTLFLPETDILYWTLFS